MTNAAAATAVLAGAQVFAGVMAMAGATLAPRNTLFGVRLPEGFRSSAEGRRAIAHFRVIVAIPWLFGLAAILLAPPAWFRAVIVAAPLSLVLGCVIGYAAEHRRLQAFAVAPPQTREIELTLAPDRLPWFMWLWPGPVAILAGAAIYLHANWDRIPQRFPVHYGINGQPNGWAEKSVQGVYGGLILGAEIVVWMLVTALAVWYGARRSAMRRPLAATMISISYAMAGLFSEVVLQPLRAAPPILVTVLTPFVVLIPSVIYLLRKFNQPRDPPDPTPEECWKAGMLYYNPNDAALMVEKRSGMGMTVNFGNPWSWVLCGFLIVNLATLFLLRI